MGNETVASQNFVDKETLTDDEWFNDADRIVYEILANAQDVDEARAALGITDGAVIEIADDVPAVNAGEQWFESDSGKLYMRYQNPDSTYSWVRTNLSKSPAGPQGPAGPTGEEGPQGPTGSPGVDGAVGPTGPTGPMGADGAPGAEGATGPAGADGAVGPAGPQGIQGVPGVAGADGAVGPQGPTGATGATGPVGPSILPVACSDETTTLTAGTAKVTFRMPFALTLTKIKASLTTASTSGLVTIDVNKNGTSLFSTALTIDANEKTSATAAAPAVLATTALADDDEITIDIDGAGTGAKGLKVYLI
jgi:hypothetical protein